MLFPLQSLTFVVSRSLLPILSHHQNDNAIIGKTYSNCVFSIFISCSTVDERACLFKFTFCICNFWESMDLNCRNFEMVSASRNYSSD
ncbi:hypothetical protein MJ576_17350 [Klebsiella pneumoniae]|nr:hypothetical protein MJ576_17350 [Klebsiella pneumoniae]